MTTGDNGKIKLKKFSDMDTWSAAPSPDKTVYNGTKTFDLSLGDKVIELLESYGLAIASVSKGDYLARQRLLLEPEKNFIEYRVTLGILIPFEEYLENEGIDYDELSEKDKKNVDDEYHKSKVYSRNSNMEFSVFLPVGIDVVNLKRMAMCDASVYLKNLKDCIPSVINLDISKYPEALFDYTSETTAFINRNNIKITNDNIDEAVTVSSRLYKDCKFFREVSDVIDDYKELFNDWIKLL